MQALKILVVEDDPTLNRSLKQKLFDEGYHVDAYLDGRSGLKQAMNDDYQAIVKEFRDQLASV